MAWIRGRALRGQRCPTAVPHERWETTTFTGALCLSGLSGLSGLTAPTVVDGTMNAQVFDACTEQVLAPTLRPGEVVIMDSLPVFKGGEVRRAIEATGADLRYLPPYLPDLNPIENVFSKLEAILHRVGARTIEASGTPSATLCALHIAELRQLVYRSRV